MTVIRGKDCIRNPEEMLFSLHELSPQESFLYESRREFRLKAIFIAFFAIFIRIAFAEHIPRVFDLVAALVISIIGLELVFKNVEAVNKVIKNKGMIAIIALFLTAFLIVFIGGNI